MNYVSNIITFLTSTWEPSVRATPPKLQQGLHDAGWSEHMCKASAQRDGKKKWFKLNKFTAGIHKAL